MADTNKVSLAHLKMAMNTIKEYHDQNGANGGNADTVGGYTIWVGTQAQYDSITSKSSTTIYLIKEG